MAATSWRTCRSRSARGRRSWSSPTTRAGSSTFAALADLIDERTRLIGHQSCPHRRRAGQPRRGDRPRRARRRACSYLLDATQSVGQFPSTSRMIGCRPADRVPAASSSVVRAAPASCGSAVGGAGPARPHCRRYSARPIWDGVPRLVWEAWGARRFATGEHSYANVLGLSAAAGQALDLGLDAHGEPAARARRGHLRDRLDALPHVTTHDRGVDTLRDRHRPRRRAARRRRWPTVLAGKGRDRLSSRVPRAHLVDH